MKLKLCFSVILLVLWCASGVTAQAPRPPLTEDPVVYTCENITQIEFCSQIGYSTASFPNYRDQATQIAASSELENFRVLAESVCSNAVVHFLCSVYAPFCDPVRPEFRVPPCRELCEYVREGCEPVVTQFQLTWPPRLECSLYPMRNSSLVTFCPPNISTLAIPSNIPTNPPPTVDPNEADNTITVSTTNDTDSTTVSASASGRSLPLSIPLFSVSFSRRPPSEPTVESNHSCQYDQNG